MLFAMFAKTNRIVGEAAVYFASTGRENSLSGVRLEAGLGAALNIEPNRCHDGLPSLVPQAAAALKSAVRPMVSQKCGSI